MEDGREGRKGVGTRLHDLSHHIDLDSTDITQSQTDVGSRVGSIVQTVIDLIQGALQIVVGGGDCHTAKVDRPDLLNIDGAFRRDLLADRVLAGTPDIDDDFITGTQTVIGRSGKVDTRLERQVAGIEDVAPENLVLTGQIFRSRMIFQHVGSILLSLFTKAGLVDIRTRGLGGVYIVLLLIELLHTHSLFLGHTFTRKLGSKLFLFLALPDAVLYIFQYL